MIFLNIKFNRDSSFVWKYNLRNPEMTITYAISGSNFFQFLTWCNSETLIKGFEKRKYRKKFAKPS